MLSNKMTSRPAEEKLFHDLLQQGRLLNASALRTRPRSTSTGMDRFELILTAGQISLADKQTNRDFVHYSKMGLVKFKESSCY